MSKKVIYLSPKCVLDDRSGAACSLRNILRTLGDAGWDAQSLTMTVFDGAAEYPLRRIIGEKNAQQNNKGKILEMRKNGVLHRMYYTKSTVDKNLTIEEARNFYKRAVEILQSEQPDVVIMFGDNALSRHLANTAGSIASSMVFYLANPSYQRRDIFEIYDQIFFPSQFFANFYYERLGIKGDVLLSPIWENQYAGPDQVLGVREPSLRHLGFVTLLNPGPEKGGTMFGRMVQVAERERPELTFLGVEGRMTDEAWAEAGLDLANKRNLWWIPTQDDVTRIYARTSVLLFPSLWDEASGRSVAEAQLGGIPVLASSHAGPAEQLNGGGFALDVPERCRENYGHVPPARDVRPWLDTLYKLMDDEDFYRESVQRALTAAEPFQPARMKADILEKFENLPTTTPGRRSKVVAEKEKDTEQATSGTKSGGPSTRETDRANTYRFETTTLDGAGNIVRPVDLEGNPNHEAYLGIQKKANQAKKNVLWAGEQNIRFLAGKVRELVGTPTFGLCHGTRAGWEQMWFEEELGCTVLGTEIGDQASEVERTIQWDFHDVKDEWIENVDFIYSNSWDHTYDPRYLFEQWARCLKPGGVMLLDHAHEHNPEHAGEIAHFGATVEELTALLNEWGEGRFEVREVIRNLPVTERAMKMPNGASVPLRNICTIVVQAHRS